MHRHYPERELTPNDIFHPYQLQRLTQKKRLLPTRTYRKAEAKKAPHPSLEPTSISVGDNITIAGVPNEMGPL